MVGLLNGENFIILYFNRLTDPPVWQTDRRTGDSSVARWKLFNQIVTVTLADFCVFCRRYFLTFVNFLLVHLRRQSTHQKRHVRVGRHWKRKMSVSRRNDDHMALSSPQHCHDGACCRSGRAQLHIAYWVVNYSPSGLYTRRESQLVPAFRT